MEPGDRFAVRYADDRGVRQRIDKRRIDQHLVLGIEGAGGFIEEDEIRFVQQHAGRGKPLLFNQIAGGKSPRLSLSDLDELGIRVAIYSTPCLFAAQTAMDQALARLKEDDGRLPEDSVGVAGCLDLLERNISRHGPRA